MRGAGRPAADAAALIFGATCVSIGAGVGHPQDGPVGQLAGDPKQARRECGHHHADGLRQGSDGRDVHMEVLAVDG